MRCFSMNEREQRIKLWFDMWIQQKDMGIDDIFTEDVLYTESWGSQYAGRVDAGEQDQFLKRI